MEPSTTQSYQIVCQILVRANRAPNSIKWNPAWLRLPLLQTLVTGQEKPWESQWQHRSLSPPGKPSDLPSWRILVMAECHALQLLPKCALGRSMAPLIPCSSQQKEQELSCRSPHPSQFHFLTPLSLLLLFQLFSLTDGKKKINWILCLEADLDEQKEQTPIH